MNELGEALATLSMGLKTLADGITAISKQVKDGDNNKIDSQIKTALKRPSQKISAKTKSEKKTQGKKSARNNGGNNKSAKVKTASETVLELVKNSNNGVDYAQIVDKTGYNKKKIANIFFNLKKQGKIKSVSKGVYTSA